ncbi:GPP34 family phosphoprotein [Kineosporia sp. NBRC 101731]|uniref:GOLPH3/VPS74 family protein n=1 Tax=Kineosporia sp. NBRC 101731 TaxID=3032199 RepID=UPI0024A23B0A|nr:GPP34 family phosphoprotein [Kineosporia sp. NBRC 101731]GLY29572.1 hypothetical protein Kisp02_29370 [Kineosporia sp. NBRC 101731]
MTTQAFSPGSQMLIVEELMLLLLDDEKGSVAGSPSLQFLLGGGLLVELALLERVGQSEKKSLLTGRKLLATGTGPLPDPLLQAAYDTIAEKPRGAQQALTKIGKGLQKTVPERLVERGILREEKKKMLGVIPHIVHPAENTSYETQLRRKMRPVLADGATPDQRTASLIALLSAGNALKTSLRDMEPPLRWSSDIRRRGKEIQEGDWGATVVSDAVKAAAAAITAATVAATTAAATSG